MKSVLQVERGPHVLDMFPEATSTLPPMHEVYMVHAAVVEQHVATVVAAENVDPGSHVAVASAAAHEV